MRHRPQHRLGEAVLGQRHRLARQPFEVAVLAEMHDGVRPQHVAQPGVEGEVVVRRHQVGRVVAGLRVDIVAARRLHADDDIAEALDRQREAPAIHLARNEERVGLGRSPALLDLPAHLPGQLVPEKVIVDQRQRLTALAPCPVGQPVRRPRLDARHQVGRIAGRAHDAIPGLAERAQHADDALGRVQPDAVRQSPVAVRIVGQHDGDALVARRLGAQPRPGRRQPRRKDDPRPLGAIGGDPALGRLVIPRLALEADGPRQDPPVDLGQRHVHRDVARRQPRHALAPGLLGAAREHDLENRPPRRIQRRARIALLRRRHREGRGVQHHGGRRLGEQPLQRAGGHRLLKRGDEDRQRVQPLGQARLDQPVDRMQPRPLHQRAVEDDGGDRRPLDPVRPHRVEVADPRTRPVDAGPQQRPRRRRRVSLRGRAKLRAPRIGAGPCGRPLRRVGASPTRAGHHPGRPQHPSAIRQKIRRVLRSALDQIGPERLPVLARHARGPPQRLVRLVVAGQRRESDAGLAKARRELLQPVAPVALATQHARHHQPRLAGRLFQIEVDRHRVREMQQRSQPQPRRAVARLGHRAPRLGQRRQLAVGGRDHDQVGRRLVQVDRLAAIRRSPGLCQQQVHQRAPTAARRRERGPPAGPASMMASTSSDAIPGSHA